MMSRTLVFTALATTFLATAMISQVASAENEEIIDRVKPVGQLVILTDEKSNKTADSATAAKAPATAKAGKATYDSTCFACHSTGAAGAPIVGNKDAWAARIKQGKDTLYTHAINGFNAMPAKGGSASLSDENVKAVVDYMVGQSS